MLILKEGVRSVKNACPNTIPCSPTCLDPPHLSSVLGIAWGIQTGLFCALRARDSVAGIPVGGIWGLLRKEDTALGGCGGGQGPAQRIPFCPVPHLQGSFLWIHLFLSLSLSVFTFQSFFNRGHGAPLGGPGPRQQQGGARLGAAQSPFSDLNRQLVNMGFPQWHLGNHAVEPVTSILLLFLLMMLGVRGLLLVGLVYLVSHLSQR